MQLKDPALQLEYVYRYNTLNNYTLYSWFMRGVSIVLGTNTAPFFAFPELVARTLIISFLSLFALFGALLTTSVYFLCRKSSSMGWSVLIATLILSFLNHWDSYASAFWSVGTQTHTTASASSVFEALKNLFRYLLNPQEQCGIVGFAPRALVAMAFSSMYFLRRSGHTGHAYIMIPIAAGMHFVTAALSMTFFVIYDVVFRPEIFRSWWTRISLTLWLLLALQVFSLEFLLHPRNRGFVLIAGVGLIVGIVMTVFLHKRGQRWKQRLRAVNELTLLFLLFAVSYPVAFILAKGNELSLFAQIHARLLSVFALSFVAAGVHFLVQKFKISMREPLWMPLSAITSVAILLLGMNSFANRYNNTSSVESVVGSIADTMRNSGNAPIESDLEAFFLWISYSMDRNQNLFSR